MSDTPFDRAGPGDGGERPPGVIAIRARQLRDRVSSAALALVHAARHGAGNGSSPGFIRPAAVIGTALVSLPVLAVLASLFSTSSDALSHLMATVLGEALLNTVLLLAIVGLGTAAIGTSTAWLVTMHRFPGSRTFEWLLILPMAMPAYIIGYAYTDFLAFAGPVQTGLRETFGWTKADYWFPDIHNVAGAGLMLTLVLYPYVYFIARAAFLEQSMCALDVARTLGHGPTSRFFRVALPLAWPAIAAGLALALMEALADFGTVQYFGVHTFTTLIYRTWFGMQDQVAASQLASALLVFVLALLVLERTARASRRFNRSGRREVALAPAPLTGWRRIAAPLACALPVFLGFVAPVLILLGLHAEGGDPLSGRFLALAGNSVLIAGMAAVVITAVAFLTAYALRYARAPFDRALLRFSTLGYALPGTVVAVGVLGPLGALDGALNAASETAFGVSPGLIFSGTIAALLFAYLVRFLAVATGTLEAGLAKLPDSLEMAGRSLGCTPTGVLARIHLPLLRRSLLTAGVLVFADVLKELPATLIVRPFNFDTVAVRVYQLASDERLTQASTGALFIVLMGLLPIIILTREISRPNGR